MPKGIITVVDWLGEANLYVNDQLLEPDSCTAQSATYIVELQKGSSLIAITREERYEDTFSKKAIHALSRATVGRNVPVFKEEINTEDFWEYHPEVGYKVFVDGDFEFDVSVFGEDIYVSNSSVDYEEVFSKTVSDKKAEKKSLFNIKMSYLVFYLFTIPIAVQLALILEETVVLFFLIPFYIYVIISLVKVLDLFG